MAPSHRLEIAVALFYLELKTDQPKNAKQVKNRFYKFPAALKVGQVF